jgi:hypothetical protein
MGRVRNERDDGIETVFDDATRQWVDRPAARVLPHLDYTAVRRGDEWDVPDDEVYHWVAGGFTALTRYPVPYRLYPNHASDPLAYALPKPHPADPSAVAVGEPADAASAAQASAAAPPTAPAAPDPAAATPAAADTANEQ